MIGVVILQICRPRLRVEQRQIFMDGNTSVCKSGSCFVTYVWEGRHIRWSVYDDLATITDSLKAARKIEAAEIIRKIKLIEN